MRKKREMRKLRALRMAVCWENTHVARDVKDGVGRDANESHSEHACRVRPTVRRRLGLAVSEPDGIVGGVGRRTFLVLAALPPCEEQRAGVGLGLHNCLSA